MKPAQTLAWCGLAAALAWHAHAQTPAEVAELGRRAASGLPEARVTLEKLAEAGNPEAARQADAEALPMLRAGARTT